MEQGKFTILSHHNIIIILLKLLNIYFINVIMFDYNYYYYYIYNILSAYDESK